MFKLHPYDWIHPLERRDIPTPKLPSGKIDFEADRAQQLEFLIMDLNGGGQHASHMAAITIGDMEEYAVPAIPYLIRALGNLGNLGLRRESAQALGKIGSKAKAAIPKLTEIYRDEKEDTRLRENALWAIGRIEKNDWQRIKRGY